MLTITSQRHAWRRATLCAIEPTALATCLAMAFALAPAHASEGDIIVQHDVTPRVAYRDVQIDTLSTRTTASSFPTQAFNQSVGPVTSALSDGEFGASYVASGNAVTGLQCAPTLSTGTGLQSTMSGSPVGDAVSGAVVDGVGGQVVQAMAGITSQISGALAPLSRGGQP